MGQHSPSTSSRTIGQETSTPTFSQPSADAPSQLSLTTIPTSSSATRGDTIIGGTPNTESIQKEDTNMLGTASSPAWADIEKDAASWNSLLTWAREQRGPQWDAGSGTYVQHEEKMSD